jgi:hypothetical protein
MTPVDAFNVSPAGSDGATTKVLTDPETVGASANNVAPTTATTGVV